MTPPDDSVYQSLAAFVVAESYQYDPDTGRVATFNGDGTGSEIPHGDLDELFARGWIVADAGTEAVTVTERGRMRLNGWLKRTRKVLREVDRG